MTLQWKSSLSGKETRIFRGKVIAGLLKKGVWKEDGYGELNGYMLKFETKGFLNRVTTILDIEGKTELGMIEYKTWKSTAVITFENKTYAWNFDSWMRKKWQVGNETSVAVFSKTSLWKNEGEIEVENISPAVVLAGLFVYSYFWKIAAAS
ncbi:hypothetical protein ACFP1I_25505 [Dyadobacter subterraneus]|uniref:Uncharacterized protein n=1 Tax=Dyadobacter subterraneus TaxID=2773304 RepID=A0ABR9WKC5_9BACT|nr:hypothetical protein [Dyadobacter subterraneus]MBE9465865.1 hypothetical protein [Dyadobacter subterraneus]